MYEMKYFEVENAAEAYTTLAKEIDEKGEIIVSRGEPTKEILNAAVLIKNPRDRIINIENFKPQFILQEAFDVLNENPIRVIHSREMLEKTMGNSKNNLFFGNEMRQAFSRWSLEKIFKLFEKDKNTRKAVLDLGNRRPVVHYPCMIYAHFIIRDNKFHMTAETRGTAISMGFTNDVFFFTLVQEILHGWIQEIYPEVELGTFMYKTISCHYYCDEDGKPTWNQEILRTAKTRPTPPINLGYADYLKDMGVLYHYVDSYCKSNEKDDIDNGLYRTYNDIPFPRKEYFKSEFFFNWAEALGMVTQYRDKKLDNQQLALQIMETP